MSTNVIDMNALRASVAMPAALRNARSWLVWRLVHVPGEPKPKKIPYYISGAARKGGQGSDEDRAALCSFDRAVASVARGVYSGVGLALDKSLGVVALDFDDCVVDGVVDARVAALVTGTYSEFSPSGTGIRAFFTGQIRDRKSHAKKSDGTVVWPFGVEFFCANGYVTFTGNVTPMCAMWGAEETMAPLPDSVKALYRERFGDAGEDALASFTSGLSGDVADASGLLNLAPKIGLTIERAKAMIECLDEDCGYDDWLKAGQSLHHEFDGAPAALGVWKDWSRKSASKYPGDAALDAKWESFGRYRGAPITATWLLKHSKVARVATRYEAFDEWKIKISEAETEPLLRDTICTGIGKDERLGDVEREGLAQQLLGKFRALGTKLTIAICRKLVAPAEELVPTVQLRRPLTEFGNAERMLDRFGDSLMFVPETAQWHVWNGIYWRAASDTEIEHYAKETVRSLVDEADEHSDAGEFFGFCAVSQQARMVRNMVTLAASDPRVLTPASELDRHKYLLGVQNGVVDLRTGELSPPNAALRITRVCACAYRPGAPAPLFRKVVLDVFNDDEGMADYFQRLMGYAALGDPTLDIMVIAHGNGSNGKSTVFNTIRKVFGSYARVADAGSFVSDGRGGGSGGGPREDLVRLNGARFVYVNEPDESGELREGSVKSMTGGDTITARTVHGKASVEYEPSWLVVMPTNHKPIIKGSDNGIWRRLVLMPFTRNFENDPKLVKDEKMSAKLAAETEGVLAWIVEGAMLFLRDGLKTPQTISNARNEYRTQMDLLAEWLDECCEVDPDATEQSTRLWLSWEAFAKERGVLRYVQSNVALSRRLDQRFPGFKGTGGVRMRRGLRLKRPEFSVADFFNEGG